MRYKTADVLAGSRIEDEMDNGRILEGIEKTKQEIEEIKAAGQADMDVIASRVGELNIMIRNGIVIPREHLVNYFKVDGTNRRGSSYNTLGIDKHSLDKAERQIREDEIMIQHHKKSELTQFLETVEDEYVSDHGLKQAGFPDAKPGRLVVHARKARLRG